METLVAILNITFIALLCWWYWRKEELPLRKFYWHALAAKLSAGLLMGIVYAVSYTSSDTFSMFEWAKKLSLMARTDFGGYLQYMWSGSAGGYFMGVDRTIFFVKIASVFALITNDNYWVSSLYFSLISFFASWQLTKVIWRYNPVTGISAVMAFLFFPSCVFWASGIIKESLAMAGLYLLAILFLQIWWRQKISVITIVLAAIAVWITWNLKYYYIGLFIPAFLAAWVTRKIVEARRIKKFSTELIVLLSFFVIVAFIASFAHPNFSINRILDVLIINNQVSIQASSPDNVIHFFQLESTWSSIIMNSPWALISGIFRPFLWEADTMLKLAVSLENMVLLLLAIMSLRSFAHLKNSSDRVLIVSVILYCCALCIFLAISMPNFGTLVRYRVGFLPFLLLLIINQPIITRTLAKLFNVPIANLSR